jgi:glutamine synthetase
VPLPSDAATRIELFARSDAARAVLGHELHAAVLAVRRYESSLFQGEDAHALTRFAWSS